MIAEHARLALLLAVLREQQVVSIAKVAEESLRLVLHIAQGNLAVREEEKEDSAVGGDGAGGVLEGQERGVQILQHGGVRVNVVHGGRTAIHQEEGGVALGRQRVSSELQGAVEQVVAHNGRIERQLTITIHRSHCLFGIEVMDNVGPPATLHSERTAIPLHLGLSLDSDAVLAL